LLSVSQTKKYYTGFFCPFQVFCRSLFQKQIDHICTQQNGQNCRHHLNGFLRHFSDSFFEKRLKDIEKNHSSDPKTYAGVKGHSSLEVKSKSGVIPHPFPSCSFHNVAGRQLYYCSDYHNSQKNQDRGNIQFPYSDFFLHEPAQRKNQDQRPETINNTVWAEKYASVGKSPSVNYYL